ncbi:MAG: hypothetical protein ACK4UO_14005 [Pseudolabrys sp.]
MSKLVKIFVALVLIGGGIAASIGDAEARHRRHYHGYYGGWGPAWGFTWGFGYPYFARPYAPYYGPYYYAPGPYCRWVRVRVWRDGRWVRRTVRRCW